MAPKPFTPPVMKQPDTSKRPSLLYVEDEDANWEIAALRLQGKYEVRRARNSQEAFAALRGATFNAILMDIQLQNSEFNGIEITQILRGKFDGRVPPEVANLVGKAPPIIFVTAYNARYQKEELRALGGDDMIAKPVDFIQLTIAITRLILRPLQG